MYKVIHYFTDLQDKNHPYKVGDIFPREGKEVTPQRLKELSGPNNRQHKPLIAEEPEIMPEPVEAPEEMPVEEKPKRRKRKKVD